MAVAMEEGKVYSEMRLVVCLFLSAAAYFCWVWYNGTRFLDLLTLDGM